MERLLQQLPCDPKQMNPLSLPLWGMPCLSFLCGKNWFAPGIAP